MTHARAPWLRLPRATGASVPWQHCATALLRFACIETSSFFLRSTRKIVVRSDLTAQINHMRSRVHYR